jgi:hypothetical protein
MISVSPRSWHPLQKISKPHKNCSLAVFPLGILASWYSFISLSRSQTQMTYMTSVRQPVERLTDPTYDSDMDAWEIILYFLGLSIILEGTCRLIVAYIIYSLFYSRCPQGEYVLEIRRRCMKSYLCMPVLETIAFCNVEGLFLLEHCGYDHRFASANCFHLTDYWDQSYWWKVHSISSDQFPGLEFCFTLDMVCVSSQFYRSCKSHLACRMSTCFLPDPLFIQWHFIELITVFDGYPWVFLASFRWKG